MKGYVEKMLNEYPRMVRERERLKKQIENCEFITADELISVMYYSHPQGERVQCSGISDKTARIAIEYREKLDRMNHDLIFPMQRRLQVLEGEIDFLEASIDELPEEMYDVMHELVIEGFTWEQVANDLYISISKLQKLRKDAINQLTRAYQKRESEEAILLLS